MTNTVSEQITLDVPQPLIIPNTETINIALVGCGGTGSFVAQFLGRLAWHVRALNTRSLTIVFIDGDEFTEDNIGRTLCCPVDVGKNKAVTLAARHNAVWGLEISAIPEMATKEILNQVSRGLGGSYRQGNLNILVGAVDSAAGRRAMHQSLQSKSWDLLIDSGNTEYAGQVIVGSATSIEQLRGSFSLQTACTCLPSPGLLAPSLLEDSIKVEVEPEDCTMAMLTNRQSLVVNQQQATVVAEYLNAIVNLGIIGMYTTDIVSTPSITVRSKPITCKNIASDMNVSESFLFGR